MVGLGSLTEALISVVPPGRQYCFGLTVLTVGKRQFPKLPRDLPHDNSSHPANQGISVGAR